MIALVMGVAGVGKTTIGEPLARALGWRFLDADDYHPPENVAKMKAGIPLQDADRWPWLGRLNRELKDLDNA
ncbi:MAG TPA: gluconokinase, partial [Burkholderiales bacterium]|nr:gluconokinase [Burkholderiales bacterium]